MYTQFNLNISEPKWTENSVRINFFSINIIWQRITGALRHFRTSPWHHWIKVTVYLLPSAGFPATPGTTGHEPTDPAGRVSRAWPSSRRAANPRGYCSYRLFFLHLFFPLILPCEPEVLRVLLTPRDHIQAAISEFTGDGPVNTVD